MKEYSSNEVRSKLDLLMSSRYARTIVAFIFTIFLTLNSAFLTPVFAHVLKTDGNIGAVLHIDPDDDPVAGEQSGFFFEFKDKTNKFKPENCNCIFSILQGGKEIFSQPLFQGNSNSSLTSSSIFFTFPEKDVYQIKVTGTPNTSDSFQPFTLNYDVRVAKIASNPSANSSGIFSWIWSHWLFIAGLTVAGFALAAIMKRSNKADEK